MNKKNFLSFVLPAVLILGAVSADPSPYDRELPDIDGVKSKSSPRDFSEVSDGEKEQSFGENLNSRRSIRMNGRRMALKKDDFITKHKKLPLFSKQQRLEDPGDSILKPMPEKEKRMAPKRDDYNIKYRNFFSRRQRQKRPGDSILKPIPGEE